MTKKYSTILLFLILTSILFTSCRGIYSHNYKENLELNNYKNGEFVNSSPTKGVTESPFMFSYKWLIKNNMNRTPNFPISTKDVDIPSFIDKNFVGIVCDKFKKTFYLFWWRFWFL